MSIFKTLPFLFVFVSFQMATTAADVNSSFSFNSPFFSKNIGLFGDAKLLKDAAAASSIQLTDSLTLSQGRVFYKKPFQLFHGKDRNFSASFSTNFSFSLSKEIGSVLSFVLVPSALDLRLFGRKDIGFLLQNQIVAVQFGISKRGYRVGILVGRPEKSANFRNLSSSFGSGGKKLNCWIDYEASSKRIEVRLSLSTALKPIDPFVSYSLDLSKLLKDGKFMVGLTSANGNSTKPHYLHFWSFKLRHPSMRIHSQPLDPNTVSKTVNEEEKPVVEVKGKGKCLWRMFGALVMGAVCGTLGAMLALYLWTKCGNWQSTAIVPEECANEKSEIIVMKADVVDEEGKKY